MTTRTLTDLYDTYEAAAQTVRDLEAAGVPHDDISLVANNVDSRYAVTNATEAGPGAGTGAGIGAVVGGGAGLLAGLGMLAIPGVGPVVAGGWLLATAVGAVAGGGVGAASGGLIGSMVSAGVDTNDAHVYAEGVRRGGTLVTARVPESQASMVEAIMHRNTPVDPALRGKAYRDSGWTTFDERAPPYTPVDIERERALYGSDRVR